MIQLTSLRRFINENLGSQIEHLIRHNYANIVHLNEGPNDLDLLLSHRQVRYYNSVPARVIRQQRKATDPICLFKIGLILTPAESLNLMQNFKKITNVQRKSNYILALHGATYYNEKRFRFGLTDNPNCPRCDEIETLSHKLFDCDYTKLIWDETFRRTMKLSPGIELEEDRIRQVFGAVQSTNSITLTVHSEILTSIIQLKQDQDWLMHPKMLVTTAIKRLIKLERSGHIKTKLAELV